MAAVFSTSMMLDRHLFIFIRQLISSDPLHYPEPGRTPQK